MSDLRKGKGRTPMRFGGAAAEPGEKRPAVVTAGVPMSKFRRTKLLPAPELVVRSSPSSEAARRFTEICQLLEQDDAPHSPLLITSAETGEGKSVVAANLALAWAKLVPEPVLLLDANLRLPALAGWLQPAPRIGLTELLRGQTELAHVLVEVDGFDLRMLPAGQPPRDATELLVAPEFEQLVASLTASFPRIVIDSPAAVPYPDAGLIGRFSKGALVVARVGVTREAPLGQALGLLGSTRIVGTLLNDLPADRRR